MERPPWTGLAVLVTMTFAAAAAQAAPFTNGGFEVPVVSGRQHVPLPGWDITKAPTCQLYHGGYIGLDPIEGLQHLAISHEDGALGEAVSQTFDSTVGARYVVQFSAGWTGNPSSRDMRVRATVASTTGELLASTNVSLPGKATWGTTTLSFVAKTASSTLTFKDISSQAFQTAIFLDDIRVLELTPLEPCKTMVGGIVANQVWTKEESPYCVTNDVYVSGLLRIKEGVEVRFEGNHVFEVGGRIRADGTADAPIRFHPADPAVGWQGLLFRDAVAGSYFVHTIIEGSKNSGVRITNTAPAFTNCVVRSNSAPAKGAGISAELPSGDLILVGCQITGNRTTRSDAYGGGISAVLSSGTLTLNSCLVVENQSSVNGGGVYLRGRGEFTDCVISSNRLAGSSNGGGGVCSPNTSLVLKNCELSANEAQYGGALYASTSSGLSLVQFFNCSILRNRATAAGGGPLFEYSTHGEVVNCVFARNQPDAIQVWTENARLRLTNSIVFDNGGVSAIGRHPSSITVAYSNTEGKVWPGPGNISVSPALCPDNYSLIEGSPCIDAGDPGLEFRDGCNSDEPCSRFARGTSRNDMGAYGGPGVCYWTQPRAEPVIRIAPDNTIGFVGQPVSLGVIATGAEPLTYQWFKAGTPWTGQTNTVLTIPNAVLASAGDYYVRVTNPLGEVNSPPVPDARPVWLGIAQLEARTDGATGGRPRLRIRNGQIGAKCAIYSVSRLAGGDVATVPGTPPNGWERRDTVTFTAAEVGWTDPTVLGAGEQRYYGVLPAP